MAASKQIQQVEKMSTESDRMRWLLRFAALPLALLSKGEVARVRRHVEIFVEKGDHGRFRIVPTRGPYPWDQTFSLPSLQREIVALFQDREGTNSTAADVMEPIRFDAVGRGGRRRVRIGLSWRGAFLLEAALLLGTTKAGAELKSCRMCGTRFVRVGRQKYCSPACTDRANWLDYPEEKKLAARAKQYAKSGWTLGARSKRR